MIWTEGLTRTFAGPDGVSIHAVRDVDLTVNAGERVAILGPNGAGKSTLMRMLSTLLPPSRGTARVAGHDVKSSAHEVRSAIGFVGQGNSAGQAQRVGDEVLTQARIYGAGRTEATRRTQEILEVLDLAHLAKRRSAALSGGQRRRLDLALGLVHGPQLLFLDEPTTGLDPQNRANLWEHLHAIGQQSSMTLVVTTHYLEEADAATDRIVVIDHGRVIADGTPTELKHRHGGGRDATLDDVFLALTGRGLRDGGAAVAGTHTDSPDDSTQPTEVNR